MIQPGARVRVLAIGKEDAFRGQIRQFKNLIGTLLKSRNTVCTFPGGFRHALINFDDGSIVTFYQVKIQEVK
jgi:hypothetical protein